METKVRHEGPELTGISDIDQKITELRRKRDLAADEQMKTQSQIDELFLSSMVPDIKKGDYISYMKDDMTTIGRVHDLRRIFGGVTIEFDIVAFIPWADEYENINPQITIAHCTSRNGSVDSISVKKGDLGRINKITREQFIGMARETFDEIIYASREPENAKQLKLDI